MKCGFENGSGDTYVSFYYWPVFALNASSTFWLLKDDSLEYEIGQHVFKCGPFREQPDLLLRPHHAWS